MARTRIKVTVGVVFGVPLNDGSRAVGQVIEMIDTLRAALCVFYSYRVSDPVQAGALPFKRGDVVAVQTVTVRPIQAGEWQVIGNHPVANADLNRVLNGLREASYVGLNSPNTNTVTALMNAYHGLAPWEIGTDTDFLRRLVYRP